MCASQSIFKISQMNAVFSGQESVSNMTAGLALLMSLLFWIFCIVVYKKTRGNRDAFDVNEKNSREKVSKK